MSDFVHLHVHSQYSLLDGLSKFPHLLERASQHQQHAIALTDHGAMYGTVHFYNACIRSGIKPIIGLEAYMSATDHTQKQQRMGSDAFHLTLLAKDMTGYRNLMRLTSIAHLEGFSYRPRIDFQLLQQHKDGIIVTSGCSASIICKLLLNNQQQEAIKWVKKFQKTFQDDFYIEIQSHPSVDVVERVRPMLIDIAHKYGIPLIATNDVHYVDAEDAEAQDALLAVQTRKTIDDQNRLSMLDSPDFYLKSTEEMYQAFSNHQEALHNTVKIANKCDVTIPTGKMIFPEYPLKPGQTEPAALREMAHAKIASRYPKVTQEIKDRLDYELDIICTKGYASYFLIVQDFVNWAKSQGIRVGPGRGSAAGSLVSYALRITSIDPLRHDLPFERFMNPQRPSPPDIDIDIADERRDEVIRYTAEKYGEDHVAQVITFGTMEARAAIRDIGRVMGMPFSEPDLIAKLIPPGTSLKQAVAEVPELKQYTLQPKYKKLIELAQKVEGSARHASTHAAAVIIADKHLDNYTPVQRESKGGKMVTQYDMYALDLNVQEDAIGLLKMDFLGLRNLSILGKAIEYIKQTQDKKVDVSDIPLDEKQVYDMLSEGETTGVFQLESAGMRRVARKLQPSRFSDLTAMVALYRPGPMELIDDFIAGKKDPKTIKYPHPALVPVLEETYGIPVYQEQVLQIANVFAGYSLGEADILRRAIGKKKKSILDKEKKRFVKGAVDKGYDAQDAQNIWGFIEKFAGYGFNKAHSASYAMIAYQTAYLKALYPIEYMTALLTVESNSHSANKDEKVSMAIEECRRMGIAVLPPDINQSRAAFSIEAHPNSLNQQAIRFGFTGVKNVGEAAIESIIESRDKDGVFTSVTNLLSRVDTRKVNKKVLDSLVRTGALDRFGKRAAILLAIDEIRSTAQTKQKVRDTGQTSLFDNLQTEDTPQEVDALPDVPEFSSAEKLKDEKTLLGVYLTDHPAAKALRQHQTRITHTAAGIESTPSQTQVTIGGMIMSVRKVQTKKNNKTMAFATLEDNTGTIDLVIFPKTFESISKQLVPDTAVIVSGKADKRDDRSNVIVEKMYTPDTPEPDIPAQGFHITIPRNTPKKILNQIGTILKNQPGEDTVHILIPNGNKPKVITLPYKVKYHKVQSQVAEVLKHV